MKKLISVLLVICLAFVSSGICSAASSDSKIYISGWELSGETTAQLKLLASELSSAEKSKRVLTLESPSGAGRGDIVLKKTSAYLNDLCSIKVNDGVITVSAGTISGVRSGMRYITKCKLTGAEIENKTLSYTVGERALFLDIGRKYYTPDFIKSVIKEISFLGMNTLVLHFSEEMGLGLESKLYPWLNGRDGTLCVPGETESDSRVITQAELSQIAEVAVLYGISLVPSFDSPGHMNYIVKKFNEKASQSAFSFTLNDETVNVPKGTDIGNYYHYNGRTSIVQGSRNTAYSRGIDISNPIAVAFTKSLLEEYSKLFASVGSKAIDIGGDELLGWGASIDSKIPKWQQLDHWKAYAQNVTGNKSAVAYDAFLLYMNDLADFVTDMGYTSVRMWNDDALRSSDTGWKGAVKLSRNIEIEYWTPTANGSQNTSETYISAGHKLHNYLNNYSYYVLGKAQPYAGANTKSIWNEWLPSRFSASGDTNKAAGYAFCVWADNPLSESENSVWNNIFPMLKAMNAKALDNEISSKLASYEDYAKTQPTSYAASFASLPEIGDIITPEPETTTEPTSEEPPTIPVIPTEPEETTNPDGNNNGKVSIFTRFWNAIVSFFERIKNFFKEL